MKVKYPIEFQKLITKMKKPKKFYLNDNYKEMEDLDPHQDTFNLHSKMKEFTFKKKHMAQSHMNSESRLTKRYETQCKVGKNTLHNFLCQF